MSLTPLPEVNHFPRNDNNSLTFCLPRITPPTNHLKKVIKFLSSPLLPGRIQGLRDPWKRSGRIWRLHLGRWENLLAPPRIRRYRRHHLMHEHEQSLGDAGRWSLGSEGSSGRSNRRSVHQNEFIPRQRCRYLLPARIRSYSVLGTTGLQCRRIRMHDVHWKLWSAGGQPRQHDREEQPRLLWRPLR